MTPDDDRRSRAEGRRRTATLHKTALARVEPDTSAIRGEAAVSLVARLTRESWSLSGSVTPAYSREATPYRFVPRKP